MKQIINTLKYDMDDLADENRKFYSRIKKITNNSSNSSSNDVFESKIDGDFEGWEGETIVKLMNGQIWQQVILLYLFIYAKCIGL